MGAKMHVWYDKKFDKLFLMLVSSNYQYYTTQYVYIGEYE